MVLVAVSLIGLAFTTSATASESGLPQSLNRVEGAPMAPDFDLPDLQGQRHRLSSYRGKVVVINFWATWCPPCLEEMPSMQQVWEALQGPQFEILAINVSEDDFAIGSFIDGMAPEPGFPILKDEDMGVVGAWQVRALPTTLVVDKQGRIIYRALGGRDMNSDSIRAQLKGLMQERVDPPVSAQSSQNALEQSPARLMAVK
jgi:thiol-disulfide isomerase/thioredoxin